MDAIRVPRSEPVAGGAEIIKLNRVIKSADTPFVLLMAAATLSHESLLDRYAERCELASQLPSTSRFLSQPHVSSRLASHKRPYCVDRLTF